MGTKDLTIGGTTLVSDHNKPTFVMLQRAYDFGVAGNTVSAADVLQMIDVPAGFMALGVLLETQTVEWGTTTPCQVGDGADTDGWIASVNCNLNSTSTDVSALEFTVSPEGTVTQVNVYAGNGGKFYPVADTVDVIPQIALDTAKVRVGVWGFMGDPGNDTAHTLDVA